jgi:dTDP-4-dehydrorhamnose 3,5-epimerase
MHFLPTEIDGAYLIRLETRSDERGSFARAWCTQEFADNGMVSEFVQANVARTRVCGTIRGLHYQVEPHLEVKLIRCTRGTIFDVVVDVRPASPTFGRWLSATLSADGDEMLYVPAGCAHGYQSMTDDVEVSYLVSHRYAPEAERGIRFDDPAFGIRWPLPVAAISGKDQQWPDFRLGVQSRSSGEPSVAAR